jgi:hypothetical protein
MGVIAQAVAEAGHGHRLNRTLTAEITALCVITGALFPGQGYDLILAKTFGMPGLPVKPGTVTPTGPALSKARALLGEAVMRRIFEIDAARSDIELGIGADWHGMETTAFDGTTVELFNDPVLAEEFGVPSRGNKPKAVDRRLCPHRVPAVDFRGRQRLPRQRERPGPRAGILPALVRFPCNW